MRQELVQLEEECLSHIRSLVEDGFVFVALDSVLPLTEHLGYLFPIVTAAVHVVPVVECVDVDFFRVVTRKDLSNDETVCQITAYVPDLVSQVQRV